jgi:hypothetical protein
MMSTGGIRNVGNIPIPSLRGKSETNSKKSKFKIQNKQQEDPVGLPRKKLQLSALI